MLQAIFEILETAKQSAVYSMLRSKCTCVGIKMTKGKVTKYLKIADLQTHKCCGVMRCEIADRLVSNSHSKKG